jgi:hypothetical protein
MNIIKKYDLYIKIFAIIISIIQPFILLSICGELWSISSYWKTPLQPLFIFVNAVTSYFFFSTDKWLVPSIFLLLLTAFSIELYPVTHNVFAGLFFLSCNYPLLTLKRFRFFGILYLMSIFILLSAGMLWFEIYCVLILGSYHLTILLYKHHLDKLREKLHQTL